MVGRLVKRGAVVAISVLALEAAYAALRPAPEQPQFDPSGDFGDPDHPTLKVVVLGDSSVTAPGVSDADQIWIRILCRQMARDRHVILKSVAIGGATAASVIEDQLDQALAFQPDLALISVGGNDAIRSVSVRRFEQELENIVASLTAAGALVVLSGLGDLGTIPRLQPPLRGWFTRRSLAYDIAHQRVAERHQAVWMNPRQDDRELWIRDRSLWSEDLFHVSPHGHARWAHTGWKTLQPALERLDG